MAKSLSMNTSRRFAPAHAARLRGREASLTTWWRSFHNELSLAPSSATTLAVGPVIRRLLMTNARVAFPTTQP
ncbi:hypothetical protein [Streptomyces sp. NPDC088146]|uniref:hypothetical protein n=1 Tax=Streptomyces sp. NPDC088146 TaxID=3365829 RepID=UPI0037F5730B